MRHNPRRMNRRFAKLLTLWIVPLLLARALIPAGFMLAADANGLSLVFCSGSMSLAPAAQDPHAGHAGHIAHAEHHDPHSGHESSGMQHESGPCPFSLAASAALADITSSTDVAFVVATTVVAVPSSPAVSAGPLRADRIRGPPALA